MNAFVRLFERLDQTNKTGEKVKALTEFFSSATDADCLWALALFTHKVGKRNVNTRLLKEWAMETAGISGWLFEESYHVVGDLAETISHLVHGQSTGEPSYLSTWMEDIRSFSSATDAEKQAKIRWYWSSLSQQECFVFNKLITGGFRIGVSQSLIIQGICKAYNLDPAVVAHRLMGHWSPTGTTFQKLVLDQQENDDASKPYPFYLSYPVEDREALGDAHHWQVEWKWDGIRSQIIKRKGELFIWSRGEELITDKFPELTVLKDLLPEGTVIDGELLPLKDGIPLTFALLQTRIGRKNVTSKQLKEAPAAIYAYDLLELGGEDIRPWPLAERRQLLETLCRELASPKLLISPVIAFHSWDELLPLHGASRAHAAEGFMLKRKSSPYQVGRKRGDWWKWKIDPMQIDGVLIYAQKGHGRRADLYSDYTFAVWDGDKLVPFAKAYSGLTDQEMAKVDAFIKRNTFEKFGPVRTVKPELVFEIGFEGIQASPRHKSGIALRFPRILRWRTDKKPEEADTLENLKAFLK